ncbi:DUF4258 domain-containing protein [Flavobacterium sp. xlx-214]|uniref:DUF4258 domain-containing protein n=1 Tax=unclassified Flavobacterium TaxID=196869 RepID=UPI0013D69788|nr:MULTISPECIES: DUF4258 domain-containing protein [unclassified Flavobacterium]MBA5793738.1 DUF4258 domain-containing protein [Flavobacterium sp. xlx-221]QMI83241.1 DUF4258 domain-containing protein [Flavobacterium sp. xlx-214]
MKFSQRLAYYLLGLFIGGLFVYIFLDAKDTQFCYLPNCRVLKDLRNKPLTISDKAQIKFDEALINMNDVKMCLTYGDVDFDKSNVKEGNGKLYVIEGQNSKKEPITVEMINFSEKVTIKDVYPTKK